MGTSMETRIIVAVFCGVALGVFASKKNRKSWVWTLLGTATGVINLLLTLVVFAVLTFLPYRCPRCGQSLTNKQAREKACPACPAVAEVSEKEPATDIASSGDLATPLNDLLPTPPSTPVAPHKSRWAPVKLLALVLNWPCLAVCLVGIVNLAVHADHASGLIVILPFAAALAAYHFQPPKWFVGLALGVNVLWVIAGGAFFGFMVAWRGQVAPMPLGFSLAMLLMLAVCTLNVVLLVRQLGTTRVQPTDPPFNQSATD